jgi:hypothetical protein
MGDLFSTSAREIFKLDRIGFKNFLFSSEFRNRSKQGRTRARSMIQRVQVYRVARKRKRSNPPFPSLWGPAGLTGARRERAPRQRYHWPEVVPTYTGGIEVMARPAVSRPPAEGRHGAYRRRPLSWQMHNETSVADEIRLDDDGVLEQHVEDLCLERG